MLLKLWAMCGNYAYQCLLCLLLNDFDGTVLAILINDMLLPSMYLEKCFLFLDNAVQK